MIPAPCRSPEYQFLESKASQVFAHEAQIAQPLCAAVAWTHCGISRTLQVTVPAVRWVPFPELWLLTPVSEPFRMMSLDSQNIERILCLHVKVLLFLGLAAALILALGELH